MDRPIGRRSRTRTRGPAIGAALAIAGAALVGVPLADAHEVATEYPLECEMTGLEATFTTSHVPEAGIHPGRPATFAVDAELSGSGHTMPVRSVELALAVPEQVRVTGVSFADGALAGTADVADGSIALRFTGDATTDSIDLPRVTIAADVADDAEVGSRARFLGPAEVVLDGGDTDTCVAADGPTPVVDVGVIAADDAPGHGHGDDDDGHGHGDGDEGPIISLDDPRLTDEQRQRAQQLLDDTREAMEAFPDVESIEAAGYLSIGDAVTGFEHFINYQHVLSPETLDPSAIESIVVEVLPDGTKRPASAMYIMGPGNTMDDVPEIAGELTTWHDHQDLCWEGSRVVGLHRDGACRPAGELRVTPPMLHVWLEDQPCGPFAGIEGSHGDGCEHGHGDGDDGHGHGEPPTTTTTTTAPPTTTTTVAPPPTDPSPSLLVPVFRALAQLFDALADLLAG